MIEIKTFVKINLIFAGFRWSVIDHTEDACQERGIGPAEGDWRTDGQLLGSFQPRRCRPENRFVSFNLS